MRRKIEDVMYEKDEKEFDLDLNNVKNDPESLKAQE